MKGEREGEWHASKGRKSELNPRLLRRGVNLYICAPALTTEQTRPLKGPFWPCVKDMWLCYAICQFFISSTKHVGLYLLHNCLGILIALYPFFAWCFVTFIIPRQQGAGKLPKELCHEHLNNNDEKRLIFHWCTFKYHFYSVAGHNLII